MYDKYQFAARLEKLRNQRWEQYKANQKNNLYQKYSYCKAKDAFASKLNIERRTYGRWESGLSTPTIDKVADICNLLDCNIDYLLGAEDLIGTSDSVLAAHYSGISIDIINYGKSDCDYLDFLNYFMHPDNCSMLVNHTTLAAWKSFLSHLTMDEIYEPLKNIIIETFQKYQAFTSVTEYNIESYKQYLKDALPESRISFSSRKLDDCICVKSCISPEKYKELCLSNKSPQRYQVFMDFIANYSFEALTNKAYLDIQKEKLGEMFVQMVERYLLE